MTWRAWLVFAALCVIWGIPYFFIKLALVEIPPVDVAWSRLALGAAVLLPVAWKRGVLRAAIAHKRAICAFAFCELVGPFFLIAQGERWVSSSLAGIRYLIAQAGAARAAVITYINPAVAALLGVGLLHERFGLGPSIGLVLILLGSWLATGRTPQLHPAVQREPV